MPVFSHPLEPCLPLPVIPSAYHHRVSTWLTTWSLHPKIHSQVSQVSSTRAWHPANQHLPWPAGLWQVTIGSPHVVCQQRGQWCSAPGLFHRCPELTSLAPEQHFCTISQAAWILWVAMAHPFIEDEQGNMGTKQEDTGWMRGEAALILRTHSLSATATGKSQEIWWMSLVFSQNICKTDLFSWKISNWLCQEEML